MEDGESFAVIRDGATVKMTEFVASRDLMTRFPRQQ